MLSFLLVFFLNFRFKEQTGIPYQDMVFFDDEYENIIDISEIGEYCILIITIKWIARLKKQEKKMPFNNDRILNIYQFQK